MNAPEPKVPYPEVRDLTRAAYNSSGCKSVDEFSRFLGGVGLRTVWRWMRGEGPLGPLPTLVMRNVAAGWKPSAASRS
jgi:hypothetical protein